MKRYWELLKQTIVKWNGDDIIEYSAALAYFTIFSLAPLLLIAVAIAGLIFGKQSAQANLLGQLRQTLGPQAAEQIGHMIANAARPGAGIIASVIGLVTLLVGAMRIFTQLKKMLNRIWGVKEPDRGVVHSFLRQYLLSFVMVLLVGLLFLVLLVATTAASAVIHYLSREIGDIAILWRFVNFAVSVFVFTLLFALIFKFLPDLKISWSDVWIGALVTSILFVIGKILLGFYLTRGSVASPYGAAGSLVVLLIFIDYSAMILFFGAEFTVVYARNNGSLRGRALAGAGHEHAPGEGPSATVPAGQPRLASAAPGGGSIFLGLAAFLFWRRLFHHGGKM